MRLFSKVLNLCKVVCDPADTAVHGGAAQFLPGYNLAYKRNNKIFRRNVTATDYYVSLSVVVFC